MQPDIIDLAFASDRTPRTEKFIIEGSPLSLKYARQKNTKGSGKFLQNRTLVIDAIIDQLEDRPCFNGPISLQFSFFFPLLQNATTERKAELIGKPYTHNPPLDALIRIYSECVQLSMCLHEDSTVVWTNAYKVYGIPRTEIIIREAR